MSPYFRKMFISDLVIKRQNETNMGGISAEVMRVIVIDYIYTGEFEADMESEESSIPLKSKYYDGTIWDLMSPICFRHVIVFQL